MNHTSAPPRRILVIVVAAIVMIAGVVVLVTFPHSRAVAARDLAPPMRDLCRPLPWYLAIVNRQAQSALRSGKQPWIPKPLLAYVSREDSQIQSARRQAYWKLVRMGTNAWPAIPALLAALDSESFAVRRDAFSVLREIKAEEDPSFEKLKVVLANKRRPAELFVSALTSENEYFPIGWTDRRLALAWLAACGPAARPAFPVLLKVATSREEHDQRSLAVTALGSLGRAGRRSAPTMKQMLQDPDEWPDVRSAAAHSLALVAPNDEETLALLREALHDKAGLVRTRATEGLWRLKAMPAEALLPILTNSLNHGLPSVRLASLDVLSNMGKSARPATSEVRRLLADEKEIVRCKAFCLLRSMEAN